MFGLFIAFAFADSACFARSKKGLEKHRIKMGKRAYRQVFINCKNRGEIKKPKPSLDPNSKTRKQWEKIFVMTKDDHGDNKKKREKRENNIAKAFKSCEKDWKRLTSEDIKNIFTYLHKYAADSPTPAKCQ